MMDDNKYKRNNWLYCINPVMMVNGPNMYEGVTTINTHYRIRKVEDNVLTIIDDKGERLLFKDFERWFIYTETKLEKININEIIDLICQH